MKTGSARLSGSKTTTPAGDPAFYPRLWARPTVVDEFEEIIHVFPNPTQGIFSFTIDTPVQEKADIHIEDINGRTMLKEQVSDMDKHTEHLFDISDFPAGIYILSVQFATSIYSQRILKIF